MPPSLSNLRLGAGLLPSSLHDLPGPLQLVFTPGNSGIRRVMPAWREMPFRLVFPWAFALAAFASWTILFPHRGSAFVTSGLPADSPDLYGVSTFRCPQMRPGWGALFEPASTVTYARGPSTPHVPQQWDCAVLRFSALEASTADCSPLTRCTDNGP